MRLVNHLTLMLMMITLALNGCARNSKGPAAASPVFASAKAGPQLVYGGTFPDPHVFPYMGAYYVFSTHGHALRTTTFAPDDVTTFSLNLDFGPETGRAHDVWAVRLYEHGDGSLHLYASLHYGWFRTVIAHFAPAAGERWTRERPILNWRLTAILAGDFEEKRNAYDGMVFRDDDGALYLLYTAVPPEAELEKNNHIVIRRLLDPATVDPDFAPRVILSPEGLASEDRDAGGFQLVEGPLLYKVGGRYLLSYSVGAFDLPNYKAGLAWSETLVPPEGEMYRKIWRKDGRDVWGNEGRDGRRGREIEYVMQSEKADWPNDVGRWLTGPGHANLVEIGGQWWLVFHAQPPGQNADPAEARCLWRVPVEVNMGGKGKEPEIKPVL